MENIYGKHLWKTFEKLLIAHDDQNTILIIVSNK